MKPLEIHVRNKVIFAKIEVQKKFLGTADYTLFDKNGVSIYIFRHEEMSKWQHVYGTLSDDVREACIDALILRFQDHTEMFYYKGERKVIDVRYASGASAWHLHVNRYYMGQIIFSEHKMEFSYHEHTPNEVITPERIEKYFQWIREGRIKWPEQWR